jgi:pilus assembly protein Flp/PilA
MTRQRHRRQRRSVVKLWNTVKKSAKDESGAVLIEYATVVALVAAAAIAELTALGGDLSTSFTKIGTGLSSSIGSATW